MKHVSVLLEEAIAGLNLHEDSIVVDATLGYAGHSSEILRRIKRGFLYAFDQDQEAITFSQKRLQEIASNFEIIKSNFENMQEELKKRNITKVNAVLFDLGVSSPQLDEQERGFSYHYDAKLDMRMNQEATFSAFELINNYDQDKLSDIFFRYGEAKFARNIAKKIVEARKIKPIETTLELVDIIKSAVPEKEKRKKHPAKQIFQAIRIEVNHELDVLKKALDEALSLLEINGRLAIITFHSLEDRMVKDAFKEASKIDPRVKGLPNVPERYLPKFELVNKKVILPSEEEILKNNRSHSAKLRVIERIR